MVVVFTPTFTNDAVIFVPVVQTTEALLDISIRNDLKSLCTVKFVTMTINTRLECNDNQ